jgi:ribosomal protein S18 acetylase RimI-like enzyme
MALMNEISKKAEELKCSKITLEVREDNYQAQNLYKKMGFDDSEPKMLFWSKYL